MSNLLFSPLKLILFQMDSFEDTCAMLRRNIYIVFSYRIFSNRVLFQLILKCSHPVSGRSWARTAPVYVQCRAVERSGQVSCRSMLWYILIWRYWSVPLRIATELEQPPIILPSCDSFKAPLMPYSGEINLSTLCLLLTGKLSLYLHNGILSKEGQQVRMHLACAALAH